MTSTMTLEVMLERLTRRVETLERKAALPNTCGKCKHWQNARCENTKAASPGPHAEACCAFVHYLHAPAPGESKERE